MRAVILAGGLGTRLGDETRDKPKPMVEIGGRPILWHILRHLVHHEVREVAIAAGYRSDVIKKYFRDELALPPHMMLSASGGPSGAKDAKHVFSDVLLHVVDTGDHVQTGGRTKRVATRLGMDSVLVTYGDGVTDLDVDALLAFHKRTGAAATVTAVRPPPRYGEMLLTGLHVTHFREKAHADQASGWINGGYIVLEPRVWGLVDVTDDSDLAADVLAPLAEKNELAAFRHEGFWACMDTPRDRQKLEQLWEEGKAPWQVWGR